MSSTDSFFAAARTCTITRISLTSSPFGLRIKGVRFRRGCSVWVNGRRVPRTLYRGSGLVLARGAKLASRLPTGVAVRIVVRNSSAARSAAYLFTR